MTVQFSITQTGDFLLKSFTIHTGTQTLILPVMPYFNNIYFFSQNRGLSWTFHKDKNELILIHVKVPSGVAFIVL